MGNTTSTLNSSIFSLWTSEAVPGEPTLLTLSSKDGLDSHNVMLESTEDGEVTVTVNEKLLDSLTSLHCEGVNTATTDEVDLPSINSIQAGEEEDTSNPLQIKDFIPREPEVLHTYNGEEGEDEGEEKEDEGEEEEEKKEKKCELLDDDWYYVKTKEEEIKELHTEIRTLQFKITQLTSNTINIDSLLSEALTKFIQSGVIPSQSFSLPSNYNDNNMSLMQNGNGECGNGGGMEECGAPLPPPPPPPPLELNEKGDLKINAPKLKVEVEVKPKKTLRELVTIAISKSDLEGNVEGIKLAVTNILNVFSSEVAKQKLEFMVVNYGYLFEDYPTQPRKITERVGLWEKHLFASKELYNGSEVFLDDEEANSWRSKKKAEIRKLEKKEEIMEKIDEIKLYIISARKKAEEKKRLEKSQTACQLELFNKLEERHKLQQQQEAQKILEELEKDEIDDSEFDF